MVAKRNPSTRHAATRNGQITVDEGRRSRVHKPTETDPKKRAETVNRAGSVIKTTTRIDTVTIGRD